MKIGNITLSKVNLQLARPYTIAFKTIETVENGIIKISSTTGLTGFGAFNPCYEVIGETLDEAFHALTEENLQWLQGRDISEIDKLCIEVQKKFASNTSARIGLEIALYDLFTQSINMPLVRYLGQKITSMPTSITIGIKNVEETIEEAKEYVDRKFKILKIKLGISLEEDIERLVKLRELFRNTIELIIDANQGYDQHHIIQFYTQTSHLNIHLIEQPLKVGEEKMMSRLPDHIKQLIAADESLITPSDAVTLAGPPKACGFFNIKLMKCGGITEALKIAEIASGSEMGLMWGCNDESIISITAALHTAFASANTKYIDLDGSLDLAEDVVKGGFILKDGIMSIADRPGLGLIH